MNSRRSSPAGAATWQGPPGEGDRRSRVLAGLILLLVISPLPFGSARPWAIYGLAVGFGLLAVAAGLASLRREQGHVAPSGRLWMAGLPFLTACGWAAVQTLPGMPAWLAHPAWAMASDAGLDGGYDSISVNPAAGHQAVFRLATAALAFVIAARLANDRNLARRLISAAALISGAFSAYGIMVTVMGTNTILWLDRWSHEGSLSATFVSRNSHAVYAGLGLLCCVAALTLHFNASGRPNQRLRERLLAVLNAAGPYLACLLAALFCNLVALMLTQSRAGSASAAIGLAVLVGLVWARAPRRRSVDLTVAGLALVVIGYALVAGTGLFQRLETEDIATNERFLVYEIALRAIADRPLLGHGLATFEDVFRMYRTPEITLNWDRDHNSYLGMALELGLPAAVLMALALLVLALRCLGGVRRRQRDLALPALGVAALALVGANAVLDFSVEIPAIAILLSVIVGVGYAQSWSTSRR